MRWLLKLSVGVLVLAMASDAFAQTPIRLTISGNEAKGSFDLAGRRRGRSVHLVRARGRPERGRARRFGSPGGPAGPRHPVAAPGPDVSIPEAFPVLIRIEPTPSSALTFAGVVSVSLHTHNLVLAANSPLALYSGPADGPLRDITRSVGIGSYRAGGSGGGFSEFMIVADTRPIDTVISGEARRPRGRS